MPLLAMTPLGLQTATPLVALLAALQALTIIAEDWRLIDLKSTWRLLAGTLPGIPLGLLLLKGAYEDTVKLLLALVIALFSLYGLLQRRPFRLTSEGAAFPFGFVAGVLGGAYNTNGPPVVIYGTARQWPPERFRANLQGYFLPSNLVIIASHGLGGLWTPAVGRTFLAALPVLALALGMGRLLNRRLAPGHFDRWINGLLLGVALLLALQTLVVRQG
jgi:uncharacterized membrane protein YfcA